MAQLSPDSRPQIQRYIRLTNLISELLTMVDEEKIAFSPAVELSYLAEKEQYDLLETIDSEEATPSLSQAQRMKQLSQQGWLDMDKIFEILTEQKANQKEHVKFKIDSLRQYFPKDYSAKQMEEVIVKLLDQYKRNREQRNRDSR